MNSNIKCLSITIFLFTFYLAGCSTTVIDALTGVETNASNSRTNDGIPKEQIVKNPDDQLLREFRDAGLPIAISYIKPTWPNSAGGIDVRVGIHPLTSNDNPIKYIDIQLTPYNAVRDMQVCEIRNTSLRTLRLTGPYFNERKIVEGQFGAVWYGSSIRHIHINKITVEMMNGQKYEQSEDFHQMGTTEFRKKFNDDGASSEYRF
jgi:hypothetical protein